MNNLPPFVYSKAFWTALSFAVAGVLGLLAYFEVVPVSWAIGGEVILAWILALLHMFKIEPELKAKALLEEVRALKSEVAGLRMKAKK